MHVVRRLFLIVAGMVAAGLVAAAFFVFAETAGVLPPPDVDAGEALAARNVHLVIIAVLCTIYGLVVGFVPAFLAELFGWRSFLFHVVVGGLIGASFLLDPLSHIGWITITGDPLTASPERAFPGMGIVGGFAYWLVTGCRAGFRRTVT